MFKDIIKPALILFLVCAVMTGALAYVNGVTKPIIEENSKREKEEALSKVLPGAQSFSDPMDANKLKESGYKVGDFIQNLYIAENVGYVVEVAPKGYGGSISMMVGITMNNEIAGIIITSHNETPGLGGKIADKSFSDQYLGAIPSNGFNVVKRVPIDEGDIQAISGATISSRAVTRGVSDAVDLVLSMAGGV